jgi:hypothetical protein
VRAAGEVTPEALAALEALSAQNDTVHVPSDRPPYGPLD